jgi:UDP-N-acetylglucosamine--dolichyl-phosphate N-acetylglucosaminephosphotransferase
MLLFVFLFSFIVTFLGFPIVIPRLKRAGITGKNMNSEKQEEIPEMGGLVMVAGFCAGIILTIFLKIFYGFLSSVSLAALLACLSTVLIVALIGIFDDLISIRQIVKAFMPIFAALPLMAIKIGDSTIVVPFLGRVNFGIFYPLVLVPLGITGATNAFNMLAGFNGLEVGLGIVCMISVSIIAYITGSMTALVISLSCLGALVATIYYNWYPAKILVGDIGTLCMGTVLAVSVIVGDIETAGFILIIPFLVEFIIKGVNKFPSKGWWGIYKNGKLYCPKAGAVSLPQIIMKIVGGIKEKYLVLLIIGIEAVFGVIAILFYYF